LPNDARRARYTPATTRDTNLMWKLVEAEDGTLSNDDLLVVSVLLADAMRRSERRSEGRPAREREIWEKLQPALRAAQGWTPRERQR
jgi:hypothetical protein